MSNKRKLSEQELLDILTRYENGTVTEGERQKIDAWLVGSANSRFESIGDKEKIQQEILDNIRGKIRPVPQRRLRKIMTDNFSNWGWAAAVLLAFSVVWWGANRTQLLPESKVKTAVSTPELDWKEVRTGAGQRLKVGFPDGSKVWLNANSMIRYNNMYSGGTHRDVYLEEGEAFFDVSSDTARAFIVHTAIAQNKVLGTAFNIRLKDSQGNYVLSMLSGVVELTRADSKGVARVTKGNRAILSPENKNISVTALADQEWSLWTENVLSFKSASWEKVKQQLEEWYGVQVKLAGDLKNDEQFTARFKNKSLTDVLKALQVINNFSYRIDGEVIYIQ